MGRSALFNFQFINTQLVTQFISSLIPMLYTSSNIHFFQWGFSPNCSQLILMTYPLESGDVVSNGVSCLYLHLGCNFPLQRRDYFPASRIVLTLNTPTYPIKKLQFSVYLCAVMKLSYSFGFSKLLSVLHFNTQKYRTLLWNP